LAAKSARSDREIFSTTIWDLASPAAESLAHSFFATREQRELAHLLERVSTFYLRNLDRTVPIGHPSRSEGSLSCLFKFASHCISLAEGGSWPFWEPEWNNESYDRMTLACKPYADVIDVKLLRAIGDNLVTIATGEKQAIEVGMEDNMLANYYEHSLGTDISTKLLGKTVKQIVHRYPHLNVLEIGAGTGGATKAIFREIGQTYGSYTFTDASSGFFANAQDVFDGQHGLDFKILDINKNPHAQGFKNQSYDLIVASMVLHATEFLETTLRNVRSLLKPGGYLVLLEGLPDTNVRLGTIFGAFPGWWAGSSDGRVLSPLLDVAGWDGLLRKTGFSGCDSATPNPEPLIAPLTAIVAQAVDDQIALLRDPLSCTQQLFNTSKLVDDLIIVGGTSPQTFRLASQVEGLLSQYCINVRTVPSLMGIHSLEISDRAMILSVNDLDEPFFKNPTKASWEALKRMLVRARSVLWVIHSRRSENPHTKMIIGLLRTARREIPTLDTQLLDFADAPKVEARIIAETLLRLKAATLWQREDAHESFLISIEPEIRLDKEYRAMIPRLVANQEMNERYNSSRRPILASVGMDNHIISVAFSDSGYLLYQQLTMASSERIGLVSVSHSLLSTVKVAESGYLFLMLGQNRDSGDQAVIFSAALASVVTPWNNFLIPTEIEPGSETDFLSHVAHQMLALITLKGLTKGNQILVLEGSPAFVTAITWRARNIGVSVTFITYDRTSTNPNWLKIHPAAGERDIRCLLPKNISVFVDFTRPDRRQLSNNHIRSQLPTSCRVEDMWTLFRKDSWVPWASHVGEIKGQLQDAVNYAHYSLTETEVASFDIPVIGVGALSESKDKLIPQSMIDWTMSLEVCVQLQPIDSRLIFSESRTYWLAGLSHSLGLSLCEWMIRHGARHFVLSSRRPNIDESWLTMMLASGAVIKVFSW
jgi:hybrid polyketide synthase/nonribosomal peptide synthetase ACE1